MNSTTYSIVSGEGHQLGAGLTRQDALRIAGRKAAERGEAAEVYCEQDPEGDSLTVTPNKYAV